MFPSARAAHLVELLDLGHEVPFVVLVGARLLLLLWQLLRRARRRHVHGAREGGAEAAALMAHPVADPLRRRPACFDRSPWLYLGKSTFSMRAAPFVAAPRLRGAPRDRGRGVPSRGRSGAAYRAPSARDATLRRPSTGIRARAVRQAAGALAGTAVRVAAAMLGPGSAFASTTRSGDG